MARRRWLRWIGLIAVGLVVAVGGVYAWAWVSTGSSTFARALVWREADVGDQDRFPARRIPTGQRVSPLPEGGVVDLLAPDGDGGTVTRLEDFLSENDTRAFLVVHDDRLVYERYFHGSSRNTLETSWSVAKSFVSTLIGIAIDDGLISGVDEPVTDHVPELAERDARFEQITLRDLLTMTSGLRYEESDLPWAGDDTLTYYGIDLRDVALERTEIERPPGQEWLYNNYNPLLLGLVLERATGETVSEYMSTALWRPLGAASDATWSLDSEDSGFEKMESGLNATALDYARFGLLFLHGGRWAGERIVSNEWVRTATAPRTATEYASGYGFFWWTDSERRGNFYALGNYGQYIYVAPEASTVIVRLGSDWGLGNDGWLDAFRDITDQLEPEGR